MLVRIYSDGVSMNNPLGSAKDKDKITAMYYRYCFSALCGDPSILKVTEIEL